MAWTRVTDVSGEDTGFNPASSYAAPAFSLTAGNWVLVAVKWDTDNGSTVSSVTDTAGNTYAAISGTSVTNGDRRLQWWLCDAAATGNGSNVVTANFSSSNPFFQAIAVIQGSGLQSSPVDATATGTGTAANEVISASFSTAQADEVGLVAVVQSNTLTDTWTWTPSSYATVEASNGAGGGFLAVAERVFTATQSSVTVRGDTATANQKLISVVTLKISSGSVAGYLLVKN